MAARVWLSTGAEGARVELANSGQPPVPAIARELVSADLPLIDTAQIADGAITRPKLANQAVGFNQLGLQAVSQENMNNNSVGSVQLIDGEVGLPALTGGVYRTLGTAVSPTATAATTNLGTGLLNIDANTIQPGDTWRGFLSWSYVHTAAATPTLTCELSIQGAGGFILNRIINVVSTAGTFTGIFDVLFRFTQIGPTGALVGTLWALNNVGLVVSDQFGAVTLVQAPTALLNTQVALTFEFRVRMTTALAANTLTVHQAFLERLITR